ncbi:MAG: hypothetical protein R3335_08260 [Anaerolineales bacterium]|nr:hypothetical protein [Anaerolineales bacterium]
MYNPDTDMLFPARAIPELKDLRDDRWAELVEGVLGSSEDSLDHLGFTLLMIKLGGCASCHADSYRAMRGCTQCSQQTIRRFKGSDAELAKRFEKARAEMEAYLERRNLKGKHV